MSTAPAASLDPRLANIVRYDRETDRAVVRSEGKLKIVRRHPGLSEVGLAAAAAANRSVGVALAADQQAGWCIIGLVHRGSASNDEPDHARR